MGQKYPERHRVSAVEPGGQYEPEEQLWMDVRVSQNAPAGHTASEMDPLGQ